MIDIIKCICSYRLDKIRYQYINDFSPIQNGDIIFGDGISIIVEDIIINIGYNNISFSYKGEMLRKNLTVRKGVFGTIKNVDKVIKHK